MKNSLPHTVWECKYHIVWVPKKSTIVGYLKGKSAIIVFENYSRLKRNFKGHSFWARGYYVNTVGLDEGKGRRYIQDQEINDAAEGSYNNDLSDPF
jgi:putative transposase